MTSNENPVILTKDSIEAANADVVDANVTVVNEMYEELLNHEEIATNALRSYFVDYYLTQALAGGFAQYVFTVPEREEVDAFVREGLEGMGATGHLELFNRTAAAFDALSEDDAEAYLDGDLDESEEAPEAVAELEALDGEFESLLETEDIIELNAAWLRSQDGVLYLDEEQLKAHIAERVALIPNLEERQAEAAEAELENAPEFELIIRELCDVAGYQLEKITMGDPNYEHDGETILAWHFATDHGNYIMIEEDDEAFMIHPETKEIIAAVEFEDA
ncbi:DMP19 family protein [Arthrobacter sp. MMS24-S77]